MSAAVIIALIVFGAISFCYTVMNEGDISTPVDYLFLIGSLLCPVMWFILIILAPAAYLMDRKSRAMQREDKQ